MTRWMPVAALAAALAMAAPAPARAAESQCTANWTKQGSFFSVRSFRSSSEFPQVAPATAFKRSYGEVAKGGYKVTQADSELGVIAAQQDVAMSGKTIPLNVLVEELGAGSRVTVTLTLSAGLSTSEDAMRTAICKIVDAAGG